MSMPAANALIALKRIFLTAISPYAPLNVSEKPRTRRPREGAASVTDHRRQPAENFLKQTMPPVSNSGASARIDRFALTPQSYSSSSSVLNTA